MNVEKRKKKEMETRTYTNVPTVGHYFLFVYPLIFSLQFFIPFFFFLSSFLERWIYRTSFSSSHGENNMIRMRTHVSLASRGEKELKAILFNR